MPKICYIRDSALLLHAPVAESNDLDYSKLQHYNKFEDCFASLISDEEYEGKLLEALKVDKIRRIEAIRDKEIVKLLFAKQVGNLSYYVKANPDKNLFEAGETLLDGSTVQWNAFATESDDISLVDTSIQNGTLITLTKSELEEISGHYAARKNIAHNQCDLKVKLVDALSSISDVVAFDITQTV